MTDPIAATWAAGTVLRIDGAASVQFAGDRALTLRVVAVDPTPTYPGSAWVTGYVLNPRGEATAKRELFIHSTKGVRVLQRAPLLPPTPRASAHPAPRTARTPRPAGPPAGAHESTPNTGRPRTRRCERRPGPDQTREV